MNAWKLVAAAAAVLVLSPTTYAQEDQLQLIPNDVKYSDTGMKNATGRSGAASIEARALLARDGTTTIEATTGALDLDAPAPGTIEKLKIKIGDVATNYNNLAGGGTFAVTTTGLARYTPLEIQANVSGIDPTRTDVVTVQEVVKRRPDLHIVSVNGPGAVRVNQPFTVSALVREANGDVGARTNCLLTDWSNNVLDRADGIWVDAGDTVQCMFSLALDTIGTHGFYVKLDNTRPADWEPRFELKSISVLVATDKQWEATSSQRTLHRRSVTTNSLDPEHPFEQDDTETRDLFNFSGVVDVPIDYDRFTFSIEEKTDGNLIYRYDPSGGFLPDWEGRGCRASDRRHAIYTVCRFGEGLAVNVVSYGTTAVYVSHFWLRRFDPATGTYSWIRRTMTMPWKFGPLTRYGSTHEVNIRITDGVHQWTASPFITLQPWEEPEEQETTCRTLWDGSTDCTTVTTRHSGKDGSASLD